MKRLAVLALLVLATTQSARAGMEVWTVESRQDGEGKPVTVRALADVPEQAPFAVLIHLPSSSSPETFKATEKGWEYLYPTQPFARIRKTLLEAGVALVLPAAPSDQNQMDFAWRQQAEHVEDLQALARQAKQRYPTARVIVGGFATASTSVLTLAAAAPRQVDGYVVIGGYFRWHRATRVSKVRAPGLILQALGHQCDDAPLPETQEIAARTQWKLVLAGYEKPDPRPGCFTNYHIALGGLDNEYSQVILSWLRNEPVPESIGFASPAQSFVETVHTVPAGSRSILGQNTLEMSLFTPTGKGPFPVVIFNHGDVEYDPVASRREVRVRDMVMAREFLSLGFAVAQAARPGIGRSSGNYPSFPNAVSAPDAIRKGETHAQEALAVLDYLRGLPGLDTERVVMAGQSAGGFAVSVLGAMSPPPPWLRAVINFSGGRTDMSAHRLASALNPIMVDAFGRLGAIARVPQLWVFAENDSRYSAATIRASHSAFTQNGGLAELLLYPPLEGKDGHFIYHAPEKWRGALRQFLEKASLVSPRRPPPHASEATATPASSPLPLPVQ